MPTIDRPGVYLGTITESTLGQSAKGLPQWVARLLADKKYATEAADLESAGIKEPGYIDWPYDDSITAFLVLFNDNGPLKNYEQLMAATGWTGQDFQDLTNLVGKRLLFRVEQEEYQGQTKLKVNWIDAEDAPPERTLKPATPDVVKSLNQKFLVGLKKPAAPAKPAAAKPSVPAPKQATASTAPEGTYAADAAASAPGPAVPGAGATAAKAVAPPNAVASAVSSESPEPAAATAAKSAPRKKTTPPPAATSNPAPGLPTSVTKEAAWEYLNDPAVRGGNAETLVAEAWIAACQEVGPDKDEGTFTGEDWARVRNLVIRDLIK